MQAAVLQGDRAAHRAVRTIDLLLPLVPALRCKLLLDDPAAGHYSSATTSGPRPRLPFAWAIGTRTGRSQTRLRRERKDMANTPSAKKAARKIVRRTAANRIPRSRMRSYVRRVEEALASGDKDAAETAFREAQPQIMKAASRGILHHNTAARKVSRLHKRVAALA